jgi:hypothetical protein
MHVRTPSTSSTTKRPARSFFNPDGNGPLPAVKFAVIDHHPHLTIHDFLVLA